MEIRPGFYDRFACLAGACRHSCCRGWEIDADGESAAYYRSLPGPLGDALRAALTEANGVWSFVLTASEDCPFLRPDGLCRVYAELGEAALCDICALHPRFFFDLRGHTFCGLGLSCEAAASLLLSEPLRFLTDAGDELDLSALLRLLGEEAEEASLRFVPPTEAEAYRAILNRCACCEVLDDSWPRELAALDPERAAAEARLPRRDAALWDRMLGYILYRQLERLDERGLPALLRFAREAVTLIFALTVRTGDAAEALRRWSSEVEYSDENVDRLLDAAEREQK